MVDTFCFRSRHQLKTLAQLSLPRHPGGDRVVRTGQFAADPRWAPSLAPCWLCTQSPREKQGALLSLLQAIGFVQHIALCSGGAAGIFVVVVVVPNRDLKV